MTTIIYNDEYTICWRRHALHWTTTYLRDDWKNRCQLSSQIIGLSVNVRLNIRLFSFYYYSIILFVWFTVGPIWTNTSLTFVNEN